jgi:SAM-dependent methyltransferase
MEDYKIANLKKYLVTNERTKCSNHSSKIVGMESFRRRCVHLAASGENILDIGGGSGVWTEILQEEGIHMNTYALDLSLSMLKERKDGDVCARGDMENLPFKDGSFDRVFFFASLHHVENIKRALGEAKRVVRVGGHIVLSEPTSLRLLLQRKKIEAVDGVEFRFSVFHLLRTLRLAELKIVYSYHRGVFERMFPPISSLDLNRTADRLDDLLNGIPFLRKAGLIGKTITIVAQKC